MRSTDAADSPANPAAPSSAGTEQDLRLLLNGIQDYGIFMLDIRGHILTWNPGAERIQGYTAAEIVGQHHGKFYGPEDLAKNKPQDNLRVAVEQGRYEGEAWRVRKDGSRFWAGVLITPLRDPRGALRGFAKITRDLTKQKRSEDILRHSEERFRLLVEGTRDYAIFMLDPQGIITSWNAGAERIKGYHADEILGQSMKLFYAQEDLDKHKPEEELRVAADQGRYEEQGWRLRRDGTRFWAHVLITALRDEKGTLRGFSKVTRDASAERQTQENLRHSEERFRLLIEVVQDYAIFMIDPEGRIETWNRGAQRLKGYSAEEIVGRHFSVFYPPEAIEENKPQELLETALQEGVARDEGWRVRKDGSRFWADVVITAIKDPNGLLTGFAKVTRDMTEGRTIDQRIRTLNRDLEDRIIELNAFTSTVAHDLRAPLRSMARSAQVLLEEQGPRLDDKGKEYAERIVRAAARMDDLINDLLTYSRIARSELRTEEIDLRGVIDDALVELQGSIQERKARIEVPAALPSVRADRVLLGQALFNLLSNALKFVPAGETPRITLIAARRNGSLRLLVQDNGIGIDPKHQNRLFQIFERLDPQGPYPGTGVGLAIVRRSLERLGGKAGYEPAPGRGSRFWIELPLEGA